MLNLPTALLPQREELIAIATGIVESRGGCCEMTSTPTKVSATSIFGAAFAFEVGDANTEGAVTRLRERFAPLGGTVTFDREDVTWPSEK
jgi:hypothetical protein